MRVKEILQQKGITQKEFAETLGMTQTGLSLAISDDGNPPLKRLRQIADALEVPITELFVAPDICAVSANCPHCGQPITVKTTTTIE